MNRKKIKKQKKEPVLIDILSDFGFKRVFADENNKDLLISLLNAILEKINVQISSIQFTQIEQLPEEEDDRKVVLDLHCLNEKGENIIIEIQNQEYIHGKKYHLDHLYLE